MVWLSRVCSCRRFSGSRRRTWSISYSILTNKTNIKALLAVIGFAMIFLPFLVTVPSTIIQRIPSFSPCPGNAACSGHSLPLGLDADITYPSQVTIGEPFSITLAPHPLSFETHTKFSFLLEGAGLEIQPKDWIEYVAGSSIPKWSAIAPGKHRYLLYVRGKEEISPGRSSMPVELNGIAEIGIQAKATTAYYLSKLWPPFSAFMGSLLTLPGIISFLKQRKHLSRKSLKS